MSDRGGFDGRDAAMDDESDVPMDDESVSHDSGPTSPSYSPLTGTPTSTPPGSPTWDDGAEFWATRVEELPDTWSYGDREEFSLVRRRGEDAWGRVDRLPKDTTATGYYCDVRISWSQSYYAPRPCRPPLAELPMHEGLPRRRLVPSLVTIVTCDTEPAGDEDFRRQTAGPGGSRRRPREVPWRVLRAVPTRFLAGVSRRRRRRQLIGQKENVPPAVLSVLPAYSIRRSDRPAAGNDDESQTDSDSSGEDDDDTSGEDDDDTSGEDDDDTSGEEDDDASGEDGDDASGEDGDDGESRAEGRPATPDMVE